MYHPSTNHNVLLLLVVFSLFNIFYLLQPTLNRYIIYDDARVQEATKRKRVDRFSNDMQLNVDRGLNILNGFSGPRISTWVYEGVHSSVPKRLRTWVDEPEVRKIETKRFICVFRRYSNHFDSLPIINLYRKKYYATLQMLRNCRLETHFLYLFQH